MPVVTVARLGGFAKPLWHREAAVPVKPMLGFGGAGGEVGLPAGRKAMTVLQGRKLGEKKADPEVLCSLPRFIRRRRQLRHRRPPAWLPNL